MGIGAPNTTRRTPADTGWLGIQLSGCGSHEFRLMNFEIWDEKGRRAQVLSRPLHGRHAWQLELARGRYRVSATCRAYWGWSDNPYLDEVLARERGGNRGAFRPDHSVKGSRAQHGGDLPRGSCTSPLAAHSEELNLAASREQTYRAGTTNRTTASLSLSSNTRTATIFSPLSSAVCGSRNS